MVGVISDLRRRTRQRIAVGITVADESANGPHLDGLLCSFCNSCAQSYHGPQGPWRNLFHWTIESSKIEIGTTDQPSPRSEVRQGLGVGGE